MGSTLGLAVAVAPGVSDLNSGPAGGAVLAVSSAELTIRMVVGLAVVGLLLLVLNRLARRVIDGRAGGRPVIAVRHHQRLDKHATVTLLTAGDRNLLIGTSGQAITLLAEGDDLLPGAPDVGSGSGRAGSSPGRAGRGASGASGPSIDVRARRRPSPIRALQNMTVRRT